MSCNLIGKHNSSSWEECSYVILPRALAKNKKLWEFLYYLFFKKMPIGRLVACATPNITESVQSHIQRSMLMC
jgi:hypothetical protein